MHQTESEDKILCWLLQKCRADTTLDRDVRLPGAGLDQVLQSNDEKYPANDSTASTQFIRAPRAAAIASGRSWGAAKQASSTTATVPMKIVGQQCWHLQKCRADTTLDCDVRLPG